MLPNKKDIYRSQLWYFFQKFLFELSEAFGSLQGDEWWEYRGGTLAHLSGVLWKCEKDKNQTLSDRFMLFNSSHTPPPSYLCSTKHGRNFIRKLI